MYRFLCSLIAITSLVSAQVSHIRQGHNIRNLVNLVYYDLPPFVVEFTTTAEIEVSDGIISKTDAQASSLSYPIRRITEEFLLEQFELQISNSSSTEEPYNYLAEVELRVVLKHSSKNAVEGHISLTAEMNGKVAFDEDGGDASHAATQVSSDFGQWMETIFATKRDIYLHQLLQSNQEMLQQIVALNVITDFGRGSDETSGSLLAILIVGSILCLAVIGCIWLIYARRKYWKQMSGGHQDTQLAGDKERADGSLDAVQHGVEYSPHRLSKDILNKSDAYLSKHRPDLHGNKPAVAQKLGALGHSFASIFNNFQSHSVDRQHPSPSRSSFTPSRRVSSIEVQAGNLAVTSERSPFDDIELSPKASEDQLAANTTTSGYRPFSSIWRNVSSMWEDSRNRQENDGLFKYQDDEHAAQIEEQHYREEQWMTFQKEEEEDYDFAFKDFPRKDGTPCLIYEGGREPSQQDLFTIGTLDLSADSTEELELTPTSSKKILSDEAFMQLLQTNHGNSFDNGEDTSDNKSPEFKNRLSLLFSEKHRQYEKRTIVERHREKRKKERDQERRERQKDMHRELEALEASIPVSEKWRSKHHVSPRPYDMSPSRSSYSPHVQIRQSPMRSAMHMTNMLPRHPTSQMSWDVEDDTLTERKSPRQSPVHMMMSNQRRSPRRSPKRHPVKMTNAPRRESSESMEDDSSSSSAPKLIRPRAMPRPPGDLFLDTLCQDSNMLDSNSLDKLSMPHMPKSKQQHTSPQSVMDEVFSSPNSIPPRDPHAHRRKTSNDLYDYSNRSTGRDLETISAMSPARRGMSPARRGMSPARRGMSPARRMSPARHTMSPSTSRGRRPLRGLSPSPKQRSNSNSSRNSDGVFDHGIAALI
eukprot:scaffold1567_cov102-Cylindrotheca_fusiformis.AAC.8